MCNKNLRHRSFPQERSLFTNDVVMTSFVNRAFPAGSVDSRRKSSFFKFLIKKTFGGNKEL